LFQLVAGCSGAIWQYVKEQSDNFYHWLVIADIIDSARGSAILSRDILFVLECNERSNL